MVCHDSILNDFFLFIVSKNDRKKVGFFIHENSNVQKSKMEFQEKKKNQFFKRIRLIIFPISCLKLYTVEKLLRCLFDSKIIFFFFFFEIVFLGIDFHSIMKIPFLFVFTVKNRENVDLDFFRIIFK